MGYNTYIHGIHIWVIIHIYMEMSQGNSLYSYLKKQKYHFLNFTNQSRRAEHVLSGVVGTSGGMWGKDIGR
jgi:hypothetical protein